MVRIVDRIILKALRFKGESELMLIGLGIIILGFVLMTGGKSDDPNVFNKEIIFSFRRITLAPL